MAQWSHTEIKWDLGLEADGESEKYEVLDLWTKDIMEVIEELFENPDYKEDICYTPLKLYTDANKTERVYNEP